MTCGYTPQQGVESWVRHGHLHALTSTTARRHGARVGQLRALEPPGARHKVPDSSSAWGRPLPACACAAALISTPGDSPGGLRDHTSRTVDPSAGTFPEPRRLNRVQA